MKLTSRQQRDLETIDFFIPTNWSHLPVTEEDIKNFFEYSDRGLHKDLVKLSHFDDGFNILLLGKSRRGLHMGLWEEGVLEGTFPYVTLLEGLPRAVVDFMKREMFKGIDAQLIEQIYEELNGRTQEAPR